MLGMLKNVKIVGRLMIGFGLLLIITAAIASYSTYASYDASQLFAQVMRFKGNEATEESTLKHVYKARMQAWMALATGNQSYWEDAERSYEQVVTQLDGLIANTLDTGRQASAANLREAVLENKTKNLRLREFSGKNSALETSEARDAIASALTAAKRVEEIAGPLAVAYQRAAGLAASDAEYDLSLSVVIAVALGALSIVVGVFLAFFTAQSISKPIRALTASMIELADGKFDVVLQGLGRKDEIGDIADAVERFKEKATQNAKFETDAKMAAEQRNAELQNQMQSFEVAVGEIVDAVSSASTELEATAGTLTETAERSQELTGTVAAASEEASTNVQSVASATEELSSSINEISRQVQESAQLANKAVVQARSTSERIDQLSATAVRINDIVELINAIAGQTNLLALNATIEAARAGDAGKEFAVVAAEVKALAEQTGKATDEIGQQISSIQGATQNSVGAVKNISDIIEKLSESSSAIAAAIEEQSAATQEISRNVQQSAHGTQQISSNITNVQRGAVETSSASSQVHSAASLLATDSSRLKLEVSKFLNAVRAS